MNALRRKLQAFAMAARRLQSLVHHAPSHVCFVGLEEG